MIVITYDYDGAKKDSCCSGCSIVVWYISRVCDDAGVEILLSKKSLVYVYTIMYSA